MTAPLVFLDTETTGLEPDADIWEFAAIRREPDGTETELHLFIEHDEARCARLPQPFASDHQKRFPASCSGWIASRAIAANQISRLFRVDEGQEKPHVVGAVPNFDTERLTRLLTAHHHRPAWHYHLIDVENLAVGWLAAQPLKIIPGAPAPYVDDLRNALNKVVWKVAEPEFHHVTPRPPWDSEPLSRAVGVDPDQFERHTAMGDARWAQAIYDRVMGGTPRPEEGDDA